jgi:hypothetical protein
LKPSQLFKGEARRLTCLAGKYGALHKLKESRMCAVFAESDWAPPATVIVIDSVYRREPE